MENIIISGIAFFQKISNFIEPVFPKVYQAYFLFLALVLLYVVFIWRFYKFLAKRDLLELNLAQYNSSEHPVETKVFALILFVIEYIIILPIVVFFWFFVMAVLLLILAKAHTISNIILVSAIFIGAVRIMAYYRQDLAKEIAKLIPLNILAIAMMTPGFFSVEDILANIKEIPSLIPYIFVYLGAIIALEFILRMFFIIFHSDEPVKKKRG